MAIGPLPTLMGYWVLYCVAFAAIPSYCSGDDQLRIVSESNYHSLDKNDEFFLPFIEELKGLGIGSEESECMKHAVRPALIQCSIHGVDGLSQPLIIETAVKLSICQFRASGIKYPVECQSLDYETCVLQLGSAPQWWTTFDGNYRLVHTSCSEESVFFEKEQILNLYSNITSIHKKMFSKFETTIRSSDELAASSIKQMELLKEQLIEIFLYSKTSQEEQAQNFGNSLQDINDLLQSTREMSDYMSKDSNDLFHVLDEILQSTTIEVLKLKEEILDNSFSDGISQLKKQYKEDLSEFADMSYGQMDSLQEILVSINCQLESFVEINTMVESSMEKINILDKSLDSTNDNMQIMMMAVTQLADNSLDIKNRQVDFGDFLALQNDEFLDILNGINQGVSQSEKEILSVLKEISHKAGDVYDDYVQYELLMERQRNSLLQYMIMISEMANSTVVELQVLEDAVTVISFYVSNVVNITDYLWGTITLMSQYIYWSSIKGIILPIFIFIYFLPRVVFMKRFQSTIKIIHVMSTCLLCGVTFSFILQKTLANYFSQN